MIDQFICFWLCAKIIVTKYEPVQVKQETIQIQKPQVVLQKPRAVYHRDKQTVVDLIRTRFGANADIAISVAMAESGLRCEAVSSTSDYGAFQVNLPSHPQYTKTQLLDCKENVEAAYKISKGGTNWYPWVAWKTGKYLAYLK